MSITRSQIARQMYADGALVDPRMANTFDQNIAINNANAQINQAMRSPDGLKSLYDQYGISNADRSRLSGGMASRNMNMVLQNREELAKQLAGLQNQNVVYSSYREPPKPPTDMFGILISDHDKYGVGSDPTKVSEADMNAFRQRVLDAQKNYYQKELDLINKDYISSGYPDQAMTLEEYMRSIGAYAKGGRAGYADGGRGYSDYASPSSTTASQDFATQATSGGTDWGGNNEVQYYPTVQPNRIKTTPDFDTNVNKATRTLGILGAGMNLVKTLGAKSLMSYPGAIAALEFYNAIKGNNQNYAEGGRIGFAKGGNTGYSDYASPSSSTASQESRRSGGETNYGSDSGGYDYVRLPTTAQLEKALQPTTVPDTTVKYFPDYGVVESVARKAATTLGKGIGYGAGLVPGYIISKIIDAEQKKEEKAKAGVTNAALTSSFFVPSEGRLPQDLITQSDITLGFNPRTTQGPPTPDYTGGDNQPIRLPIIAEAPSDVESTPSDFDLYAALEGREAMRFGENPYGIMGVAQRFAEGGEVRQAYGLGKLVRKATKAVKKVLKSDIGKAALLYGAGTYLGGTKFMGGDGTLSFMDRLKNPALLKNLIYTDDKFSPFKGITAATALTGLFSKNEEEEDEDLDKISSRKDESGLKELIATYKPLRFQLQKPYQLAANGGRMGYEGGGNIDPADLPMSKEGFPTYEDIETKEEVDYPYENKEMASEPNIDTELFQMYLDAIGSGKIPRSTTFDQYKELMNEMSFEYRDEPYGPFNRQERTMANEGGLMNLGGKEMDLRGGGFVPLGAREKADDVPARLSKNEFVFTADAVRAAGGGDVDRGADLMYKTMKDLESRVG